MLRMPGTASSLRRLGLDSRSAGTISRLASDPFMGRPVAVLGLDGDDGKHIIVVACLNPPEAYASKDQKHLGHIVAANLIPAKDAEKVSEREHALIIRAFFALRVSLTNLYEVNPQ
jgi:hypothetical protein